MQLEGLGRTAPLGDDSCPAGKPHRRTRDLAVDLRLTRAVDVRPVPELVLRQDQRVTDEPSCDDRHVDRLRLPMESDGPVVTGIAYLDVVRPRPHTLEHLLLEGDVGDHREHLLRRGVVRRDESQIHGPCLHLVQLCVSDRFSAVERRRRRVDAPAAEPEVRRVSRPLYQVKAEFFKTLGHPARIRVLELLSERDHSVAEILSDVGIEATSLSQQLAVLRRSGLVATRKQGSTVIYSLTSPDVTELLRVARTILTGMLSGQVELLEDLQEPLPAPQPDR